MGLNMAEVKCNNCRICAHVNITDSMANSYEYYNQKWEDVSCNHPKFKDIGGKSIEFYADENDDIEIPKWCPLKSESATTTRVHKTYAERQAAFKKVKPTTEWDDIEEGEFYHIPPILNEKRADWFVIAKDTHSIRIKEITNLANCYGYVRYIWKSSSDAWKFMAKHKMKDMDEIKEKIKKDVESYLSTTTRQYAPSI